MKKGVATKYIKPQKTKWGPENMFLKAKGKLKKEDNFFLKKEGTKKKLKVFKKGLKKQNPEF